MISIAEDHGGDIVLPPFIEVAAVIEFAFVRLPHIKRFIENQKTEPVACIQKRRGGWVVGCSHRVVTGSLEQLNPALLSTVKRRGPERTVVVVDAATREFDGVAVQQQSFFCRPRERPNTKGR